MIAVAGSTWIFSTNGFGVVLSPMALWLSVPIMVVDAFFCAGFTAYCLHFALRETRGWWAGYVAAKPGDKTLVALDFRGLRRNPSRGERSLL